MLREYYSKENVHQPIYQPKIVLVNDDESLFNLFTKQIKSLDYTDLVGFHDPNKALEYIEKNSSEVDVLITRYAMHKIPGTELILKAKDANKNIGTIIISGTFVDSNVLLEYRVDFFLNTPFPKEALGIKIDDVIRKYKNGSAVNYYRN